MAMSLTEGLGGALGGLSRGALRIAAAVERQLEEPRRVAPQRPAHQPSAVRIERSQSGEGASQTAVTLWFGEGPALPGAGAAIAPAVRGAVKLGVGLLGAGALAALTVIAERERRLDAAGRDRLPDRGPRVVDATPPTRA